LTLLLNAKVSDRVIVLNDPVNMIDPLGLKSLEEKAADINSYVNWYVDQSGLEEAINAPPAHPLHWEKTAIWGFSYPILKLFGAKDIKLYKPWGHPLFGGHGQGHDHSDDPCK
jgi:hypothetical protein